MGLCAERRETTELHKANLSSATLVVPLDVTTPRDSFRHFAWNYRELANTLPTLVATGLDRSSNPQP